MAYSRNIVLGAMALVVAGCLFVAPSPAPAALSIVVGSVELPYSDTSQIGSFDVFVQSDESVPPSLAGHQVVVGIAPGQTGMTLTGGVAPTAPHIYVFDPLDVTYGLLDGEPAIIAGDYDLDNSYALNNDAGLLRVNFQLDAGLPAGTQFNIQIDEDPDRTFLAGESDDFPFTAVHGTVTIVSSQLDWTAGGTNNLWSNDDNWDGTVVTGVEMVVDLAGGADAKVDADFNSAAKLTLGGTNTAGDTATLTVEPNVTLTVDGDVAVAANGKFVANVEGSASGKVSSTAGSMDISSVESLRVDWVENGASSMFGGVYTVAEYAGGTVGSLSGEFSNAGSNIGGAYVEAVDYSGGTVDVTLYQQKVGDVDLDGDVEFSDLSNLLDNWGIGTSWGEGDTDFSGDVVFADLSNLLDNWGTPLQSGAGAEIGVVPEPGTLLMLIAGMAGLLIQRKRR